jgi:hypothetical protein
MRQSYTRALAGTLALALTGLAGASAISAQTLSHLYTLDGVFTDALGGPALTSNGGTLGATGLAFGVNQGPSLSNGLADGGIYTVETYFSIANTSSWVKLIDYWNRTSDHGLYSLGGQMVQINPGFNVSPATLFTPDAMAHLVITRDASHFFQAFVNGSLIFALADGGGLYTKFTGPDNVIHFFRDDGATGGEASAGFVDYIRVYDGALSAEQVAGRYANRADQLEGLPDDGHVTPEPMTIVLLGSGLGAVGATRRRRVQR